MSASDALAKYYGRLAKSASRKRSRRNAKPELKVRTEVMAWLKANGFSCHVIESKAVYSFEAGCYVRGQTEPGVADVFGAAPNGVAVFIELKAPGRRSTLKPHQRAFLLSKIDLGAFAVCVDGVECLAQVWAEFEHRHKMEPQLARALLLRHLPAAREQAEGGIEGLK